MKKTMIGIICIFTLVIGFMIPISSYSLKNGNGIIDKPLALISYSGFEKASVDAAYYGCHAWSNNLSGTEVIASAGWRHNNSGQYPWNNNESHITKNKTNDNSYLAQTTTYFKWAWFADWIYEADINLNDNMPLSNVVNAQTYNVQNILTHEIGHAVGLKDLYGAGDTEKTMYGKIAKKENKKCSLHSDDIAGFMAIYG